MPSHLYAVERYEAIFDEADEDLDDVILLSDLRKICSKYNYKGPILQLKRCFEDADRNKDKQLTYEEYMLAMGLVPRIRPKKQQKQESLKQALQIKILREVFEAFDQDNNGVIDKKEMQNVFKELGKTYSKKQVQQMIDLADKDGSGTLDYEEFLQALLSERIIE